MAIYPVSITIQQYKDDASIYEQCKRLGIYTRLPDATRNYTIFNHDVVSKLVRYGEKAIPSILNILKTTNKENVAAEGLYILDRMIDAGVNDIEKTYPVISRFNSTTSPTLQVLLAGIYRKTQVPDGFGPLCKMLIRDSMRQDYPYFDPTEEIGGAILEYLRNKNAVNAYSNL